MFLGVFYFFIEIIDNLFQVINAISLNSQFSDCCKTTKIDSTMVAIVTEKSLTQIKYITMTTPMEGNMAILSPETMIAFTSIAPLCNF